MIRHHQPSPAQRATRGRRVALAFFAIAAAAAVAGSAVDERWPTDIQKPGHVAIQKPGHLTDADELSADTDAGISRPLGIIRPGH